MALDCENMPGELALNVAGFLSMSGRERYYALDRAVVEMILDEGDEDVAVAALAIDLGMPSEEIVAYLDLPTLHPYLYEYVNNNILGPALAFEIQNNAQTKEGFDDYLCVLFGVKDVSQIAVKGRPLHLADVQLILDEAKFAKVYGPSFVAIEHRNTDWGLCVQEHSLRPFEQWGQPMMPDMVVEDRIGSIDDEIARLNHELLVVQEAIRVKDDRIKEIDLPGKKALLAEREVGAETKRAQLLEEEARLEGLDEELARSGELIDKVGMKIDEFADCLAEVKARLATSEKLDLESDNIEMRTVAAMEERTFSQEDERRAVKWIAIVSEKGQALRYASLRKIWPEGPLEKRLNQVRNMGAFVANNAGMEFHDSGGRFWFTIPGVKKEAVSTPAPVRPQKQVKKPEKAARKDVQTYEDLYDWVCDILVNMGHALDSDIALGVLGIASCSQEAKGGLNLEEFLESNGDPELVFNVARSVASKSLRITLMQKEVKEKGVAKKIIRFDFYPEKKQELLDAMKTKKKKKTARKKATGKKRAKKK